MSDKPIEDEIVESTEPIIPEVVEEIPITLTPESVAARFKQLSNIHPNLKIAMPPGFALAMNGSYPIYQQILIAPFVASDGQQLQASTVITLTKAEWTNKNMEAYTRKKLEAFNKLLDWVQAMVVPVRAAKAGEGGGEDQVKVAEWGEKKVELWHGQPPTRKIELTDL